MVHAVARDQSHVSDLDIGWIIKGENKKARSDDLVIIIQRA